MGRSRILRRAVAAACVSTTWKAASVGGYPAKPTLQQTSCAPDGNVLYRFVDGDMPPWTTSEKNAVISAMDRWEVLRGSADTSSLVSFSLTSSTASSVWQIRFADLPSGIAANADCSTRVIKFSPTLRSVSGEATFSMTERAVHEAGHAIGLRHSGKFDAIADTGNGYGVMSGDSPRVINSDDAGQVVWFHDFDALFAANANPGFETGPSSSGVPRYWYNVGGSMAEVTGSANCYRGQRRVNYKGSDSTKGFKTWVSLADISYPTTQSVGASLRYRRTNTAHTGYTYAWLYHRSVTYQQTGTDYWNYGLLNGWEMETRVSEGPLIEQGVFKGGYGTATAWQFGSIPQADVPTLCTPGCQPRNRDYQLRLFASASAGGQPQVTQFDDVEVRVI